MPKEVAGWVVNFRPNGMASGPIAERGFPMSRTRWYEAGVLATAWSTFFAGPALAQYSLEYEVDPPEAGFVSVYPNSPAFEDGDLVTVTASPEEGWQFVAWEGDVASSSSSMTFSVTSDTDIVARFEEAVVEYVLTAYVDPSGAGSIVRDPGDIPADYAYAEGTEVTLTAYAADGWVFTGWSGELPEGADPANPELPVVADSDQDYLATFSAALALDDDGDAAASGACGAIGTFGLGLAFSLMLMMKLARPNRRR